MTFDEAFRRFPVEMQARFDAALAQVKAWGTAVPKKVVEWLKGFVPGLANVGKQIDALIAKLPRQPKTPEDAKSIARAWQLKNLYLGLWGPLTDTMTVANGPGFGNPLLVPLVAFTVVGVGTVALSVAGVAWALAASDYSMALQKGHDTEAAEVQARLDAAKAGVELQPNTLRKPPAPPPGDGPGWWPVAAVAALGVGLFVYKGAS